MGHITDRSCVICAHLNNYALFAACTYIRTNFPHAVPFTVKVLRESVSTSSHIVPLRHQWSDTGASSSVPSSSLTGPKYACVGINVPLGIKSPYNTILLLPCNTQGKRHRSTACVGFICAPNNPHRFLQLCNGSIQRIQIDVLSKCFQLCFVQWWFVNLQTVANSPALLPAWPLHMRASASCFTVGV